MTARLAGIGLLIALALPWSRTALESVMALHMLVQIPLLAVAGGLLAVGIPVSWRDAIASWNRGGVTGILIALIVSAWWMVPRALDLALASPLVEMTKFVSLPLCVGAPVALSWRGLGGIARGFVIANVVPMWAVVGWMYVAAPTRLCNYYLTDQQVVAGVALLWVSLAAGVIAGLVALRPVRAA